MSLLERFEKLLANYTVRQEYKKSFKIIDDLLAAVCEEEGHEYSSYIDDPICERCGDIDHEWGCVR